MSISLNTDDTSNNSKERKEMKPITITFDPRSIGKNLKRGISSVKTFVSSEARNQRAKNAHKGVGRVFGQFVRSITSVVEDIKDGYNDNQ